MKRILMIVVAFLYCQFAYSQVAIFKGDASTRYRYGLKKKSGKIIVPPIYTDIWECKDPDGEVYYELIDHRGYRGLLNKQGKTIIELGDYSYINFLPFSSEFIEVKSRGKYGVYNTKGKLILPIDFDLIDLMAEEVDADAEKVGDKYRVWALSTRLNGKSGLCSLDGKWLIPPEYDYIGAALKKARYVDIGRNKEYGIFDLKCKREYVSPCYYSSVKMIDDDFAYAGKDAGNVVLLRQGKEVFCGLGNYIKRASEDVFEVHYVGERKGRNHYLIDSNGDILENYPYYPDDYLHKSKHSGKEYHIVSDSRCKWGLKDSDGRMLLPVKYDCILPEKDGPGFYLYDGKYAGYCSDDGKIIVPPDRYSSLVYNEKTHLFKTFRDGYQGLLDSTGVEIIPPAKYEEVHFRKGASSYPPFFYVKENGRRGVVDTELREIIPPLYRAVWLMEPSDGSAPYFCVEQDGMQGMFSVSGEPIVPPSFTLLMKQESNGISWVETIYHQYSGVYDCSGNEIIPADRYTRVRLRSADSFYYFDASDDSDRHELFDLNGRVLFPLSEFKQVSVVKDSESKTGYAISAWERAISDRRITFELYTGKVLSDNRKEIDLSDYINRGDEYFERGKYAKAAQEYTSALGIRMLDYVVFNRGLAYYNSSKYDAAVKDFILFKSMTDDENDLERADGLIKKCHYYQSKKEARNAEIVSSLFGLAFGVMNAVTANGGGGRSSGNSSFVTDGSGRSSTHYDAGNVGNSSSSAPGQKKKCGFCGGKGSIIKSVANYGIKADKYCDECQKTVSNGHYHETCTHCHGSGVL